MARYGLRGGAFLRHGAAPPSPPSLRGREAAEAIQWGRAACEGREAGAPPQPPSLRGGAAAEAIQWGRRSSHGRAVSCVGLPDSGLLRARFARARNDGEAA